MKEVSDFYDVFAEEYAELYFNELDKKPFDRSILLRFAELTKSQGIVSDIGCGTGHIGRFLNQNGVQIIGVDLSKQMLKEASRLTPYILFEEGNMLCLRFKDAYLAGIVAFYSIVHLTLNQVELAFNEFNRVIIPGGYLLISFHCGDEVIRQSKLNGERAVEVDYIFHNPDTILAILNRSGFSIQEAVVRYPYKDVEYPSKRAYILAKRSQ